MKSNGGTDKLIGQRVRDVRIAKGMTQGDLAAKVGVSFQQIQKYENGRGLSVRRLLQIAKALRVGHGELLDG